MAAKKDTTITENEHEMQELAALDFDPVFTDEEAKYNELWGMRRRMMLATLCRSPEFLLERLEKDSEGACVALNMADHIAEYQKHLEAGIKLAETAVARLKAVAAAIQANHA